MRILPSTYTLSNSTPVHRILSKFNRSRTKLPILRPGTNSLALRKPSALSRADGTNCDLPTTNTGFLRRYLADLKCKVTVWGSTVVELEVKLDEGIHLLTRRRFLRRFRHLNLRSNGRSHLPNIAQIAALRPQASGSDLLINSPKGSGKTFLYLLPHLLYHSLLDGVSEGDASGTTGLNYYRFAVLLPTIDLVVEESRVANSTLGKFKKVSALLYRDIALNDLNHVMDSDVIYSTPKSFLKLLIRSPSLGSAVRFVVVDESERMVEGEFATLLVRIRDLLPRDSQIIFLSNFSGNHALNQFISRFSKLNFKIISFHKGPERSNPVGGLTKHIYGPIRSVKKYEHLYEFLNSSPTTTEPADIEQSISIDPDQGPQSSQVEESTNPEYESKSATDEFYTREDLPRKLDLRIQRNRDLILGTTNKVPLNRHPIEFVLYEPSDFVEALLREISLDQKTLVYFPTVRMCQFCYVYFKHYLKAHEIRPRDSYSPDSESYLKAEHLQPTQDPGPNAQNLHGPSDFAFYSLHTGLSLEKRRFAVDNFKLAERGLLFCTNLALGLNFPNVSKVIQIAFSFNTYEVLSKFEPPVGPLKWRSSHSNESSVLGNRDSEEGARVENLLFLNGFDGHILHHYYKNNLNVTLKQALPSPSEDGTSILRGAGVRPPELAAQNRWSDDPCLMNSCELMYRSLLGYYAENARRLHLERWVIPSFLNELVGSFGLPANFPVSRQFAARTQLLDAPGLEVSRSSSRKSDLIGALKSYPGFLSKLQQSVPYP